MAPVYADNNPLEPGSMYTANGNSSDHYLLALLNNWGGTDNNGMRRGGSEGFGNSVPNSALQWVSQSFGYDGVNRLAWAIDSGRGAAASVTICLRTGALRRIAGRCWRETPRPRMCLREPIGWRAQATMRPNLRGELIQTGNGPNFGTPNNAWEAFTYDGVNRLKTMTDNGGGVNNERDFAYDAYGNMWVSGNTGFNVSGTMPTANVFNTANRLNNADYDPAGNQLNVNGSAASYDAENRMAQLAELNSLGGGQMTYYYDGEGRRVEKVVNGAASTVYVYDAQGLLAAEYTATATAAALRQTCYLSTDHLGSTRMVTDGAGNVVARHDYLPFGEEIVNAAGRTSLWGASDGINQKFTGKERDSESGLDFFGARYYGSSLGRWTSPDWSAAPEPVPYADLTNPQSLNLYGYVGNNPLSRADADGHCCSWDDVKTTLDVVGFVPVVGDVANAGSGVISLAQRHYGDAALSFAAAVPVVGVPGRDWKRR